MRNIYVLGIILLMITGRTSVCQSQEINRFEYHGSEEGLSQDAVFSIACDRNGFLWIGTMNGLNRFDGRQFKQFVHTLSSDGLTDGKPGINGRIENIWIDDKDFVWLENYNGHFSYFNQRTEVFGHIPEAPNDEATAFVQYATNKLVVGTKYSGAIVFEYDETQKGYRRDTIVGTKELVIENMHVDKDGRLWLLSNVGLYMVEKEKMMSGDYTCGMTDKGLSLSTMTSAVCETETAVYFGTKRNGLIAWIDNRLVRIASDEIGDASVEILNTISGKDVAVGISNGHVYVVGEKGVQKEAKYDKREEATAHKIYTDRAGNLWILTTPNGISRYDVAKDEYKYYTISDNTQPSDGEQIMPVIYEDRENKLWIGTHANGLMRYESSTQTLRNWRNDISDERSISSNSVLCIAEDMQNNLWIGTGQYKGGLLRIVQENKLFSNYTDLPDVHTPTDMVTRSLMVDPLDKLWVGNKGGNIYVYSPDGKMVGRMKGIKTTDGRTVNAMVYAMKVSSDGRLWLASKGYGIFVSEKAVNWEKVGKSELRFEQLSSMTMEKLKGKKSNDHIYSIAEDRYGQMWAASYGNGLYRIVKRNGQYDVDIFNMENSDLLNDKVRYVLIDSGGSMWVCTIGGVCRVEASYLNQPNIKSNKLYHKENERSLPYNDVCYAQELSDGRIVFSTLGGGVSIVRRNDDETIEYENISTSDGVCNNTIYGTETDNEGNLWISTENGITRFSLDNGSAESYNDKNGLLFNLFSEATIAKKSSGEIYIGNYKGFVCIHPQNVGKETYEEQIVVTNIYVNGKEAGIGNILSESSLYTKEINLRYNENNISIDYMGVNLTDPTAVRYRYKLDGLDKDWNNVGKSERATYTNLTHGTYVFRLCNSQTNKWWSEPYTIKINIAPPTWLTWWAKILYVVAIVAIVSAIAFAYAKYIKNKDKLLAEKQLNDDKLRFFTNIAHEIRTPLTLIVGPINGLLQEDMQEGVRNKIRIIKRNSERMLMLVNQLMEFRKAQNGKLVLNVAETNISGLLSQVAENFKPLAEHKKIRFEVDVPRDMQSVWVDKEQMDIIVFNLLSNAFKFTKANSDKRIELMAKQNEKTTSICVSDEGKGIADTRQEVLFKRYSILSNNNVGGTGIGLSLVYELVKLHHGTIKVDSEVDNGTTFWVELPNGREHFENDENVRVTEENVSSEIEQSGLYRVESETKEASESARQTMLVVEDDVDIQEYICSEMSNYFDIERASDGEMALQKIRDRQPDVIVTDIMMPVMDGNEMIGRLREDFETSHIPIVALSARSTSAEQIETYNTGADMYVTKPFTMEHLLAVVQALLRGRTRTIMKMSSTLATEKSEEPLQVNGSEQILQEHEITSALPPKDEEFMRRFVQYTEEHYKDIGGIDEMAQHFNVSRTVFFNKVKALTGKGPLDFVKHIKFRIAADMLRKGYGVAEAAYEIGYTDVKYFSRQYKQIMGYTPSQEKREAKR